MGDDWVDVLVESPTGSRVKYEWDKGRRAMRLDRRLHTATVFPADYGFIADTKSADDEALDVLVLTEEPAFPGCWVRARPIGVFWIAYPEEGDEAREPKVLAVPLDDPDWAEVNDVSDLPQHRREEISHFFDVYKDLEPSRSPSPQGFDGRATAVSVIERARTE